jgi:hypothetical protein
MLQNVNNTKTGRVRKTVPAGREADAISSGVDVESNIITSGAMLCNRTPPCDAAEGSGVAAAGETTVIIHELKGGELPHGLNEYLRSSGIVYRAMRMLEQWKYVPARISNSPVPVDIIALRKSEALLIQVIYSRMPVPDAKTLEHQYAEKVNHLRRMGTTAQFRKLIMVYSPRCGWKYYEVLPGGLIPAWHLPEIPEE